MNYNHDKALAADAYLIQHWDSHTGSSDERRSILFQEFVELGIRGRWKWHKLAENFKVNQEERAILRCRPAVARSLADRLNGDLIRVMMLDRPTGMSDGEIELRTDLDAEFSCEFEGSPYSVLPELVYSLTAFDDPDDVAEARAVHDQTLWVTGVYWIVDKILWVDEYGKTIRQKTVPCTEDVREAVEAFEKYKPFESTWWTEADRVGKYAEDEWWI